MPPGLQHVCTHGATVLRIITKSLVMVSVITEVGLDFPWQTLNPLYSVLRDVTKMGPDVISGALVGTKKYRSPR
jgi:hypothetical protein